ncbi:MAG: hypothetical protein QNJ72_04915 [Pleurocapsa sp. MO_226.B13]|nr:hypothetical protein [Pleurocapsa sp. MO_226.B13]
MNYVQPQGASAPMPQQVNQPQQGYATMQQPQVNQPQQGYAPMPQQVQQPQIQQPQVQQPQGTEFYGATIDPQTMAVVQQCYGASNTALNTTLNDNSTVAKSLYFGARDMFKTLYVNQISSQRGSKPTTPDYELASNVFEQTFGTVGQPKVDQMQLCLTMKTFAPNMLPDCVPGNRPHEAILSYILNQNWHSQNVRTNNGVSRNNSGNGNATAAANPFNNNGGAQSKAAAAAGFVPQQQVGFMAQPQAMYNPQQAAQTVAGAMPSYGG